MIKKFTLLLLAMLCIAGVKAKTNPNETELLTGGDWTASWSAKSFAAQSGAKLYDEIVITYKAYKDDSTDSPYVQLRLMDSGYNSFTIFGDNKAKNSVNTINYEIISASDLEKIQSGGFLITGTECIVTSVKLITYDESYDAVPVTIGSDGIATWSCEKKLNFNGSGVTPYYASAVDKGVVTLSSISEAGKENTTWDYQGYIVIGEQGTYSIPVAENDKTYYPGTNYLIGSSNGEAKVFKSNYTGYVFTEGDFWYNDESDKTAKEERIKNKYRYIFAKHGDNIGFYMLSTTYSESEKAYHTLAAHKAYLETNSDVSGSVAGVRGLTLDFGDGTTAIWNTVNDKIDTGNVREDGVYYTLQGTRVQNPSKGLYILNGKKVFIK